MRVYFCLLAAVVIFADACGAGSPPTSRPLGVFNVVDSSNGAGGYVVKPTGVFWSASNLTLPYSGNVPDSCVDTVYFPPVVDTATLTNQLDAGPQVSFQTDLGTGVMTPDTIPGKLISYQYHGPGVPHTPGADIIFTIPGAAGGVDAATQHMVTAKRLVLGPVDTAPADSLHLTWLIGQPGLAAVNIYLIYATATSSILNRQIFCQLYDDGDQYLNVFISKKWKNAAQTQQKVTAFRYVTTYTTGSNNLLLLSISKFDTLRAPLP